MQLKDLLPKDGLLPFLQQYPTLFEVTLTGQCNRKNKPMFTFKVLANIDDELVLPAPAIGWGSSASSAPAVGGGSSTGGGNASSSGKLFAPGIGLAPAQAAPAPAIGGTAPTTPPPKHPPPGDVAVAEQHHQPLVVQQAAPAPASGGTAPAQAAPAPAVGGAAPVFVPSGIPVGPASSWSINDMVTYLDAIALDHLNPIIRDNGLDGAFFLQCAEEDLQAIGIGQVQRKKMRMYMPQ